MGKVFKRSVSSVLVLQIITNLFCGFGVTKASAASVQYTVVASEDNLVRQTSSTGGTDYSNMINGGETVSPAGAQPRYMQVKENTATPRRAYLKFSLTDYPENITSATLYMYGKNNETTSPTVTARVYGVSTPNCDSWSQASVTWNTQPDIGDNVLGTATYGQSYSWQSMDVTNYIKGELSGDKIATFGLAGGNSLLRIESRDTTTVDETGKVAKPYLVINGTPVLKTVALATDSPSLRIGQTAKLSVAGTLDTNAAANLSGATISYSSNSPCVVMDDPTLGVARGVSDGAATITVTVTLDGVTKTSTVPIRVDGIPPAEVTNISSGLVNGYFRLSWTDPADEDFKSVSVYNGSQLLGTATRGTQSLNISGLNPGQSYTLTFVTKDTTGNMSTGATLDITYAVSHGLNEAIITASTDTVKPGQSVTFNLSGKMTDGTDANLSGATVTYLSSSGGLEFKDAGVGVATAAYATSARVTARVTLNDITRDSAPVLVRVYPVAQDEFDGLRIKYLTKLTGYDADNVYDLKDPDVSASIAVSDASVRGYWDEMNKSTYTWSDLDIATSSTDMTIHTGRLTTMARMWATYGSRYYQDEALLNDTIEGWQSFYQNRYNENSIRYGNWFDWEVSVPRNVDDSMVLLYDAIPYSAHPNLITNLNKAIDINVPRAKYTAANRVYICSVLMLRGITGKDSGKIQEGSSGLSPVFLYVTNMDGFYKDGSFLQHQNIPYAGGYGKTLLTDISEALWLVSGSPWDNTDPEKVNVFKWYFDSFEPNMFKGQLVNSVDGREISRDYVYQGYAALKGLLIQMELSGNQYLEKEKSAVKYHIQNGNERYFMSSSPLWYMQKAKQILNDPTVQSYIPLQGNFEFYNQDTVSQWGPGWMYNIKMHSDRIENYETINDENVKAWYSSDGMTQLYLDPMDYLSLFWITVDPSRLPGITVDRDVNRPAATAANRPYIDVRRTSGGGEFMQSSWVGGVSLDGQYGTTGMDFKQHDYADMDVSAKKSWFMFDDEIVGLGAGIHSTSDRNVETVVDNRELNSSGDNTLTVDGAVNLNPKGQESKLNGVSWIQLDGKGGYVFPGGSDINMLREERSGKAQDINPKFYYTGFDDFNSSSMQSFWTFGRKDDTHYNYSDGKMNIVSQQGTLQGTVNTTKNIMLTKVPREDFFITTSLNFSPTQEGHEAGLILKKDDDNYVYVSKGMTSQGSRIIAISEVNGIATVQDFPNTINGNIYFKIDKSGDHYDVYASDNDTTWGSELCTFTNPMAGTDRMNSGLNMGLFAQNGTSDLPEITASFEYFHIWHTKNYMTLWFDHGVRPNDETYSYIQLPKKSVEEVASYSSNPDVSVLSNTKEVQAVKEKNLGLTGMNFWNRGSLGDVKANNPSSVMLKDFNGALKVAVSDPTQKQSKISFEIKKKGISVLSKDSSVTVLQLSPTIKFEVDVSQEPGKTHNVSFSYDSGVTVADFAVPELKSASFDSSFKVIGVNDTVAPLLTAQMDDNGQLDLSVPSVVYYSSNNLIATVDNMGRITGINPGIADIMATISYHGITKTAKLQVLVPTASPSVTSYKPLKDTYVRSGIYESATYGSSSTLYVKNSNGDDYREAYFNFDLSSVQGEIESVKFYATGMTSDSTGTYVDCVLKPVNGNWDETSTRYTNKPELGAPIISETRFTKAVSKQSFDITEFVKEQLKSKSSINLALAQDVRIGRVMYVYSREDATRQPYIEIITHRFEGSVHNSEIDLTATDFDKNITGDNYKDISTSVSLNGNNLIAIKNGAATLVQGVDYTVLGNVYTIKKEYLAQQMVGQMRLDLDFSQGEGCYMTIDISDTTPPPGPDGH